MKLTGIEIRNFRSIGDPGVALSPWRKCNILIGQNNSGKSNAIWALKRISDACRGSQVTLGDSDFHKRSRENQFAFTLRFVAEDHETPEYAELVHIANTREFDFTLSLHDNANSPTVDDFSLAHIQNGRQGNLLAKYLLNLSWSSPVTIETIQRELLQHGTAIFSRFSACIPPVDVIPEFREIRSQPGSEYSLNGLNLIGRLAAYQHPLSGNESDRKKFDFVQELVKRLLHLSEATLEVTYETSTIMLKANSLRLPLSSYGTGVHELVILVTAILSVENAVCCIEEPEIHLHPGLQRELIRFITEETTNSYLISTHSPTLINASSTMPVCVQDKVQVFHFRLLDGATVGGPVLTDEHSLGVLNDLGVLASDILQSNCVVWVEGPSDRIYLKHWLELMYPEWIEGLHYSIMFYGGRLLAHLSAAREKVPEELISLLKINQHAIVVMDSDRQRAGAHLNPTKKRVREECEASGGHCWITDGREVENYLPPGVVIETCREERGVEIDFALNQYDEFEKVLSYALKEAGAKDIDYAADKPGWARKFIKHFAAEDMSAQLRQAVERVGGKIKEWNP